MTSPQSSPQPLPETVVKSYFDRHYHVVMWPDKGELKGPTEEGWKTKPYTFQDYTPSQTRVGIITGQEVAPGRFLHDVDIDWGPGYQLALVFLPKTEFVYGRASKHISHCFYTLPEPLSSLTFRDPVDKTTLLEIRGTMTNGELGLQSMVPPSVWQKEQTRELLEFRVFGDPTHFTEVRTFQQRSTLAAISMLLAKRLGHNGFGHEARLAWAGFLLRASIAEDDLVRMGEAISFYCNNREIVDVRRVVQSTAASLQQEAKKVRGGPALAKLIGGEVGRKVIDQINQWLGRDQDFRRTPEGVIIRDSQENVKRGLRLMGYELSYQTFAERMLVGWEESEVVEVSEREGPFRLLEDHLITRMWLRLDSEYRFRPSYAFFEKVVIDTARENRFHPVRDYLRGLKWDGIPRIDQWLATYGGAVDTQESSEERTYLEAVSSIVLIAAVRRIFHPGSKYDEMLVLESDQGLNKSGALRALCPSDEWFSDDLPLNCDAKEIIERTLGKWIIEASDLVGGRKADRDHLKSMLSRQTDGPARMAYAHTPVERARQFIIVGTTNSAEYLADSTGARRFWPVRVQRFDVEGVVRDRDQLWAEAVGREKAGESIRLPEELWVAAGHHQEQRREIDAWEEAIEEVVATIEPSTTGRQQVATRTLWTALHVAVERRDRLGARRISEIMQRLGFSRANVREGEEVVVGYVRDAPAGFVTKIARRNDDLL